MYGSELPIARTFSTYYQRHIVYVLSNYTLHALRGETIILGGYCSQRRSFRYFHDLHDCLIRLLNGEASGPINLDNLHEFIIRQLAE